jgi:hypothetical protein
MRVRLIAAGALLATIALAAKGGAQTTVHLSGAAGMSPPVGDLGDASNVGFNLNFRVEGRINPQWGWRGDMSWDRFGGRGPVDNWTYAGLGGNMVHYQAGSLYEYGGLGIYDQHQQMQRPFGNVDATNLGLQAGVGYNFARAGRTNPFVEVGLINVATSGSNSIWFPVRFGIRF